MKKKYIFLAVVVEVVLMLVCSRTATYYFTERTNIEHFSKNASLLTLLFMLFFFLGSMITSLHIFIFRKQQ